MVRCRLMLCGVLALLGLLVVTVPAAVAVESAEAKFLPPAGAADSSDHAAVFAPYIAEQLDYDISFLWFDRLARGTLRFRHGSRPGTYEAELDATTLGVASWLTGERRQHYLSQMELMPDGKLRTLFQQSLIAKGTGEKRREKGKRYVFDYPGKAVRMLRLDGPQAREAAVFPMEPDEQPNDFLTCFFNFRAGRFGAVQEGADFTIPTFTRDGKALIYIHVLTAAERKSVKGFPAGGLLAQVQLDAEELDTEKGAVFVWFDSAGRPARGLVENVLGLGNVRGELRMRP